MRKSIAETLMDRDGLTREEADACVDEAREDLHTRLEEGDMPFDLCEEWFGLEPDYLDELMAF